MNKLELHPDIEEVLLTEETLQSRARELAAEVSRDYAGQELHLVTILKGALVFLADFSRALDVQVTLDFMVVSSYVAANSSGEVRILKDLDAGIRGRHVLVVEDIIDNGTTLDYVMKSLRLREPASLKICTLLDKPERRKVQIKPDYNGFVIPNKFVVGYGLDYQERYRNLPYLAALKREIYEKI